MPDERRPVETPVMPIDLKMVGACKSEGEEVSDEGAVEAGERTHVVVDRVLAGPLLQEEHGKGDEHADPVAGLEGERPAGASHVLLVLLDGGADLVELLDDGRVVDVALAGPSKVGERLVDSAAVSQPTGRLAHEGQEQEHEAACRERAGGQAWSAPTLQPA